MSTPATVISGIFLLFAYLGIIWLWRALGTCATHRRNARRLSPFARRRLDRRVTRDLDGIGGELAALFERGDA